ncbi:MAG: disulfide bond formation protein B [Inquilinus limosus]|uniref:Disulfide bond formation protein B n=1 Tax=Inquilinus limosus TaxID=171674 RepID=A0A952FLW1_9PROT|nr:disulfide bond formation protein B [Inquilinus limosus]
MSRRLDLLSWLTAALGVVVLGTVLASQYLGGLQPCELCLYQRWPWGAAIALGVLAVVIRPARRVLVGLAGLVILLGGLLAAYHAGVEYGWFPGFTSCTSAISAGGGSVASLRDQLLNAPVVRCDVPGFVLFGISMAGYNAILSVIAGLVLLFAGICSGSKRAA